MPRTAWGCAPTHEMSCNLLSLVSTEFAFVFQVLEGERRGPSRSGSLAGHQSARNCVSSMGRETLHAHCALLEVRLTGNRIVGSQRNQVRIPFGKMKRHEDLAGSDDAGNSQFNILYATAA